VEKKGEVSYHFCNEDGGEVKTKASRRERSNRYLGGNWNECLVYTGKKSGNVYYTWQLSTGEPIDRIGESKKNRYRATQLWGGVIFIAIVQKLITIVTDML
jgi:hypothetical protein